MCTSVVWPGMVVPFVLPDTWASPARERERDSSLGKEEGTPRDSSPLNLSFPRSRYPLREMNSPDERIWRTVIVSVGAAGISRGGLGPMAQVARKSFQGFSSLLSMLDEGGGG